MEALAVESKKLYLPLMSKILKIDDLTNTEKRYEIVLPENQPLGHKPGQFVEVSIFGFGEAPISICSSPTKTPSFELTVRKTGRLTDKISAGHSVMDSM
jgi:NAD(P)H-flavin reductase